jgi:uncharacterized membrane-anchored protein YjiN (DUF445 family)
MTPAELPGSPSEPDLSRRLASMRLAATALVAAMAVLFVVASSLAPRYPAVGWLRAFAEAAMIGGLADWFAVTALFRRPLGLPIPHTAVVPTRKDAIGRALARFIRDHFLVRETIERRLERADVAGRVGHWLMDERNSERVSRDVGRVLDWIVGAGDGSELRSALGATLRAAAERLPVQTALAALVDTLASSGRTDTIVDELVRFARTQLDRHRFELRLRIADKTPWWLPRAVDQEIYDRLVGEIERILDDIASDPQHVARAEILAYFRNLRDSLATDPQLLAKGRAWQEEVLGHPALRSLGAELWTRTHEYLRESLAAPGSPLRLGIEREIRHLGAALAADDALAEQMNAWLRKLVPYVVENYRGPLSEIVSETIASWDAAETSRRIELHIGRDLQFIRVNGTLVGGLVGVAIYAVSRLVA